MAIVNPFQGIRPAAGLAHRVAALPYDVYHREEAAAAARKEPLSFLNIDRPETQFAPDQDMYAPEVYEKAREMLWDQVDRGIYQRDPEKMYYLYELIKQDHHQTGIVACCSIDDYQNGIIKKHENTRPEKEQDRIRHVDFCNAQTGPIFLAYRESTVINEITQEVKKQTPEFDFVSEDGIGHRGWKIDDPGQIKAIRSAFASISDIYIADGHHRAASAVRVGQKRRAEHPDYDGTEEFNYFLSILYPDTELTILDYNRTVRDLNGLNAAEFLDRISEKFEIEKLSEGYPEPGTEEEAVQKARLAGLAPQKKGCFSMLLADGWYRLQAKPEFIVEDPVEGLDVSYLQRELLAPILGITDPKTDARIDFVGGVRGLVELERRVRTDSAVAFAVCPVSIHELFAVADAHLLMPPKSTWFEPKPRSGLFLHEI